MFAAAALMRDGAVSSIKGEALHLTEWGIYEKSCYNDLQVDR